VVWISIDNNHKHSLASSSVIHFANINIKWLNSTLTAKQNYLSLAKGFTVNVKLLHMLTVYSAYFQMLLKDCDYVIIQELLKCFLLP